MKISDIRLFLVTGQKTIRGNGSLVLDGKIELKYMVMEGERGLFITFKGADKYFDKKTQTDKFSPAIFIKDEDLRKEIQNAVIAEYNEKLKNNQE